jgi:hypothetical protein
VVRDDRLFEERRRNAGLTIRFRVRDALRRPFGLRIGLPME